MFNPRMSRRTLLKLAGASSTLAVLNVQRWALTGTAQEAIRSEWTFTDGFPDEGVFETPILTPETAVDSIDVAFLADEPGGDVAVSLRTLDKGAAWSDWQPLGIDPHSDEEADPRRYCTLVLSEAQSLQVRVEIGAGLGLRELRVGTFDAAAGDLAVAMNTAPALIDGFIIPREAWGADEKLRNIDQDPTKPVRFPPRYQAVQKVILHHTATPNNPPDVNASLRAIYFYHAVTQGWGDIGYNFLIDAAGRVYEGRFGGPNVIGAHATRYNTGSMGVSLLGNFDLAGVRPPQPMLDAFVRLVRTRAPQVDVTRASDFADLEALANLCGHGDVMATSCPGSNAHPLLPELRGRIAGTGPVHLPPPIRREQLDVLSCRVGPATVYQNGLLEVRMRFRNSGRIALETSGAPPGYIYEQHNDYVSDNFPKIQDAYRFTLGYAGRGGNANPYRWGYGRTLYSGDVVESVGYVRMRDPGTYTFSVGIIKEWVQYLMENQFQQRVMVLPPPVTRQLASREPGSRYFDVTGQNVPRPFADYWDANGGLRRFGYPLTAAFEELSETDGKIYLTQYFERARFELHPEYEGTKDWVLLGLVGVETNRHRLSDPQFQRVAPRPSTADRLYFNETGHTLGGIFKNAWESRGGLPIFGFPISEEFPELSETDGQWHMVQYFERNRFEHHQDYADTYDEVMLGHLAREILIRRGWLKSGA